MEFKGNHNTLYFDNVFIKRSNNKMKAFYLNTL